MGCHLVPGYQTTLRALPALARWVDPTKMCNIDQYLNPVKIQACRRSHRSRP
jgi:hypothetical protein